MSTGLVLLAILVLGNLSTIAATIPLQMMILSLASATVGAVAIVVAWTGRGWGRRLGAGVCLLTTLASAPVTVRASRSLQYVAGATVAIAVSSPVLLRWPAAGHRERE